MSVFFVTLHSLFCFLARKLEVAEPVSTQGYEVDRLPFLIFAILFSLLINCSQQGNLIFQYAIFSGVKF